MSQYSEIMEVLNAQSEQLDWCVRALKHLLGAEAGWQPEARLEDYEEDLDLDDGVNEDWVVPIHAPRAPKTKPCPHNSQGLLDGKLVCIRCGTVLGAQGVIQDRLSPDGQRIIADPNPPIPRAGEQTRDPSSKNPGGPLVPD